MYICLYICIFVVTAEKDRSMRKWKIGAGCHGDTARAKTRDRHFCVMHFNYVALLITFERIGIFWCGKENFKLWFLIALVNFCERSVAYATLSELCFRLKIVSEEWRMMGPYVSIELESFDEVRLLNMNFNPIVRYLQTKCCFFYFRIEYWK